MTTIKHWFLHGISHINILSIDIVAGALAGSAMALRLSGVSVTWEYWVCLASAVWVIYTADHLVDAIKARQAAVSSRHRFHYRHRRSLLISVFILALIAVWIAFTGLDNRLLLFGMMAGSFAGLYLLAVFVIHSSKWLQKEVFVAGFYTAGIWGGPFILMEGSPDPVLFIPPVLFYLLALADLLLLAVFDEEADRTSGFPSFVTLFGRAFTIRSIWTILAISLAGSALILTFTYPWAHLIGMIFIVMTILLMLQLYFRNFMMAGSAYRLYNELTFLLPGLVIFL